MKDKELRNALKGVPGGMGVAIDDKHKDVFRALVSGNYVFGAGDFVDVVVLCRLASHAARRRLAHKYTAKVEDTLDRGPAYQNIGLEEFLTLTDDEILILEVEMTLDGEPLQPWTQVWNYWLRHWLCS
jgi:hypothetical protein